MLNNTTTTLEQELPIEQLSHLVKQSPAAFAATMAVMFYILFKIHGVVDSFWLYTWTVAVVVMNIYLLVWLYFVKRIKVTTQKAITAIRIYQLQAILHGTTWGLLPFILHGQNDPELQFFAYIVLCGMAAGAIGTTAMIYHIYLSFVLPTMLPVIITQLFFGDQIQLFSSNTLQLLIIFVVSVLVLAHTYYESVKISISLIVENKQLLETATNAFNKAEAANKAKTQFLANMSHELRTPLNAVIGYSEMIHENAEDKYYTDIDKDARRITLAGKHLLSLINNVLDLSKIESGKMEVFIEEINIKTMLQEVIDTTQNLIDKNQNSLDFEVADDPGVIHSDHTKLKQVLFNIISNASKFTSNGNISIKVLNKDDELEVTIADTGIGMNENQLSQLTQPFVQADASTTRQFGGTGLGMNLSYLLCKMLHIKFDVKSQPDVGTTFTLHIPYELEHSKKTVSETKEPA